MSETRVPLKFVYASKDNINNLNEAGILAFSKDTQDIVVLQQVGDQIIPKTYSGIVKNTQEQIRGILNPSASQFYFAYDTGKVYYYNQGFKSISNGCQRVANLTQLNQITLNDFNENCLYLKQDDSSLWYGTIVNDAIDWKKFTFSADDSSDSSNSSSTFENAHFQTIKFSVQNLPDDGIVTFSYQTLGIDPQQQTIVQLIDDVGLIRDDIFPIYWDSNGLNINFNSYKQYITQNTEEFAIKYLVAQSYIDAGQQCTSLCTVEFDPSALTQEENYIQKFSYDDLNIAEETFVQLIDGDGLIRDDVIPVYWQDGYLCINYAQLVEDDATQLDGEWKIKYLSTYKTNYALQISKLQKRVNELTQILNALLATN